MVELKVQINDETFTELEPTLFSWLHVIREYTYRVPNVKRPEDRDYSYWHRERPQIGFLSIAAWQNGWAVLQEWGTQKKGYSGRNDLWIGRGKSEFFIEAKHGWCSIGEGEHQIDKDIGTHLGGAKESAQLLDPPAGHKIAAAFISSICRDDAGLDFNRFRQLWLQKVAIAADAVAIIAHGQDECPKDKGNNWLVGSALLLAKV